MSITSSCSHLHRAGQDPRPWLDCLERVARWHRGPPLWRALHEFARTWKGDITAAQEHFAALDAALPCGECRQHWRALLAAHPPDLQSAAAFHRWTVDRHNDVNTRLGKPLFDMRRESR